MSQNVTSDSTSLLRVLVVDDNQDAADSLSLLLSMWGYDVHTAYGARPAPRSGTGLPARLHPDGHLDARHGRICSG